MLETWILPLANHFAYPIELNRLRSQVLLEVLPGILDFRTPYFNSVRELQMIIQPLQP